MTPRERIMAFIIGGAVGVFLLYQAVNFMFISPVKTAETQRESLEGELRRLDGLIAGRRNMAQRWLANAGRTLSFSAAEASNRFSEDLKRRAERNGFADALFTPVAGGKIGNKTDISTVVYRVSAQGPYTRVLDLVKDYYKAPYLSAITRVSVTPVLQTNRPMDEVKMELTIETPVLPQIDKSKFQEVAAAASMPPEQFASEEPVRDYLREDSAFALLTRRNIFKPYVPPPQNVVMVQNDDWKTVAVNVRFMWEGEVHQQKVETVASKASQSVTGLGDIVEIEGSYADGKTFGPQKFNFSTGRDWTYKVPTHHPPPPPDFVTLAVQNNDKNDAYFDVSLTMKNGQVKSYPSMKAPAGKLIDVDQFEVQSLTIAATYQSGKPAGSQLFSPKADKQTFTIPPEPAEAVVSTPQPVSDPPADGQYTVTGLVTYRGTHEMVASGGPTQRKVIPAGEAAAVDGGTLLGVHPLGGVVKMPSGNFYLYPLGKKFTDRVKLEAKAEEELPLAIDAWAFSTKEPAAAD